MKRVWAVAALALLMSACGDEPSGPADLNGTVTPGEVPLGALVVELSGKDIGRVEGVGETRAVADDRTADSKRAILVSATGEPMRFTVYVEDQSLGAPTVAIIGAIGLENQPITNLSGIRVGIER